jgi:hypothetical protein
MKHNIKKISIINKKIKYSKDKNKFSLINNLRKDFNNAENYKTRKYHFLPNRVEFYLKLMINTPQEVFNIVDLVVKVNNADN